MEHETGKNDRYHATTSLTLHARPERRFIRVSGSERFIDCHIQVSAVPIQEKPDRPPLHLALVLDRSGSMQGEKLRIAKRATLAVLDQLTWRDRAAVVVFDNRIDVIQPVAQVTPVLRSQVSRALQAIEARASTALHEGWLTGCHAIAGATGASRENALARCFLLTDGIANVGVTDPERIASEAASIHEHTAISTSTFGIGHDYDELLLGPLAIAGGGQFHHLRTPDEIFNTFVGELGELLSVAARQVRLEVEVESGMNIDLISAYWMDTTRRSITIGDLQHGKEQHVIMRVHFPRQKDQDGHTVRVRLHWLADEREHWTDWQELHFSYASHATCDAEQRDPEVMHQVGLHHADYARREAIARNNRHDLAGARAILQETIQQITRYAGTDQELHTEIASLRGLEQQMAKVPLSPAAAKENYYQQQRRSRSQSDYRGAEPDKK